MDKATIKLSKELKDIAKLLDARITEAAGERMAFTLIVYAEGRASYVGNCDRADAIKEMKYLISLWEQDMPDVKAHDVTG